jgi:hypothetical protein
MPWQAVSGVDSGPIVGEWRLHPPPGIDDPLSLWGILAQAPIRAEFIEVLGLVLGTATSCLTVLHLFVASVPLEAGTYIHCSFPLEGGSMFVYETKCDHWDIYAPMSCAAYHFTFARLLTNSTPGVWRYSPP